MLASLKGKTRTLIGGLAAGGLLTAALLILPLRGESAPTLQGKVIRVSDGDTLVVQIDPNRQEKVRLLGIDTPEMAQKPWGERAKAFTESLALNKIVRLEPDVQPRDQYGRLLAYAYVGKTFLNYELVRQGYAMVLTYPPNVAHVETFTQAQELARKEGKGIWNPKDKLKQSPRDFRRQKNASGKASQAGTLDATAQPPTSPRAAGTASEGQMTASTLSASAVIANAKSKIYHRQSCPLGANIREQNRLILPSTADARTQGFTACKRCGG